MRPFLGVFSVIVQTIKNKGHGSHYHFQQQSNSIKTSVKISFNTLNAFLQHALTSASSIYGGESHQNRKYKTSSMIPQPKKGRIGWRINSYFTILGLLKGPLPIQGHPVHESRAGLGNSLW